MDYNEKRKHPRIKLITKVTHVADDFFHYYYSRDLSVGGIFLETEEPFSIGTTIKLEFPLKDVAEKVTVIGKVVRIVEKSEDAPGPYPGMGIEFVELKDDIKVDLADFIGRNI